MMLGQHEPIISEALFNEVQEVLNERKRKIRTGTKMATHDILPLRGFLICPRCGRILTGSASKGCYHHYYYYHCLSSCGCRFKAENVNELFVKELKKYVPRPGMSELYVTTICEAFKSHTKNQQVYRRQMLFQIDELNIRLRNAREMLADQKLSPDDYRELKSDCATKINELEAKLSGFTEEFSNINFLSNSTVNNLCRLDSLYEDGTIRERRQIIGSIYPEKLIFDGFQYRTTHINEAARLIYTLDKRLIEIKNRKDDENSNLSGEVDLPEQMSNHFIEDLQRLAELIA